MVILLELIGLIISMGIAALISDIEPKLFLGILAIIIGTPYLLVLLYINRKRARWYRQLKYTIILWIIFNIIFIDSIRAESLTYWGIKDYYWLPLGIEYNLARVTKISGSMSIFFIPVIFLNMLGSKVLLCLVVIFSAYAQSIAKSKLTDL